MQDTANTDKRPRSQRVYRALLMLGVCAGILMYLGGCLVVYLNARGLEELERAPVDMQAAMRAERYSIFHDSEFFRVFAEKLTYYEHQPEVVNQFFAISLQKAPSSHESFFSYAYYVGARRCCREQLEYLLQETVRRCPTHPRMNRIAATYFLALNDRAKAMAFVRKALELEPASAPELFQMLEQGGTGIEAILAVTPDTGAALIQLGTYLTRMNPPPPPGTARGVLSRLNGKDLTPEQRLQAASLAWSAGDEEMAKNEAALASQDPATKAEALAFETQMLWNKGKYVEAEKLADRTEQEYRTQVSLERAARYAMEFASLQRSQKQVAAAKQRMLRTINDYPAYAPAYFQTAQFFRDESVELELFYLKKACDLSPDNQEYKKVYANRLLETNHLKEAEAVFSELLSTSGADRDAFLGLARCHIAFGDRPGALEILQQAVQRAVTSDQIYYQLGQLYASIGEYEKAALAYIEYARITPGTTEGWNLAGDAYVNLGRYLFARDQYRKVLSIDPANKHAIDALANLDLIGQ